MWRTAIGGLDERVGATPPMARSLLLVMAVALGVAAGQAAAQDGPHPPAVTAAGDGPYVLPAPGGGWVARSVSADLTPVDQMVAPDGELTIPAVGEVPAFTVPLRPRMTGRAPEVLPLDRATRLLVLADTHGEYEVVVEFLQRQGVIDAGLNWVFGDGQMAVTGDMFDRGPHQLQILWLLYRLEAQAQAAGGALHVLIGNHESLILRNDLRYLHARYPETARILGAASYTELFTPETLLGDWLRAHVAVLKLGDLLLLHGGISPQVMDADLGVEHLNAGVRASWATTVANRSQLDARTALIAGSFGPLWFRGYFAEHATSERPYMTRDQVERSLERYGVSRILVGHTVVEQVMPLYDGRVIAVQVYPRRDDQTGRAVLEGAMRIDGRWFAVNAQGERRMLRLDGA